MVYIQERDYLAIIFEAHPLSDINDIKDLFLSKYNQYKTDNPRFEIKLKEVIEKLLTGLNSQIKKLDDRNKKDNYKYPDGTPMGKTNYETYNYHIDKLGFGSIVFPQGDRISKQRLINVKKAYKLFLNKIEETQVSETSNGKKMQSKISHKTRFLLLIQLGFFDLKTINSLTLEQRGNLLSLLLNMSFDNAKDYAGNIFDLKGNSGKKSPFNKTSIKQANDLLPLFNLPPI